MAAGQPAVKCRLFSKNMDDVDSLKVGKDGKQHYCAVVHGLDSYLESVVSVDSEARSEGRGTDSPEEAFESWGTVVFKECIKWIILLYIS